jgi:hypothetical protein
MSADERGRVRSNAEPRSIISNAPRFPRKLDVWMSEQFADTIATNADRRELTSSAVVREALARDLSQIGALPPRPNGCADADHVQA